MRRLGFAFLVLLAACGPSAWERHSTRLREARAHHDTDDALIEQRWLVDHAFDLAPPEEQGREAEMNRYLKLADLAAESGHTDEAVVALRSALQTDPARHAEVLRRVEALPLDPAERKRVDYDFSWNLQVLDPSAPPPDDRLLPCWQYRAREVHIRTKEVHQGLEGGERRISYDARPWLYDPATQSWRSDGGWTNDASAETERVSGPPRSRYRAIAAADGGFFTEGPVPPCHRRAWTGPFDPERDRLFVATDLPQTPR